MKSNFFKKFFLITSFLIFAAIIIIYLIVNYSVIEFFKQEKHQSLYDNCHSVAVVSANSGNEINKELLADAMHALTSANDNTIFVVDNNGSLFACGCDDWFAYGKCNHGNKMIDSKIIKAALTDRFNEVGNLGGFYNENCITSAIPIESKHGIIHGVVFASSSIKDIEALYSKISNIFLLSAIFPILILFILEYILSYRFTKPLRLMSKAAKQVSEGNFSIKIPVNSKDEIGVLSQSFNEMSSALAKNETVRKDFVANVSHELRTPMTNIGGFIDGILDGTIPKEKWIFYLTIISSEIKRLTRTVQSMFNLSKLETGDKKIEITNFDLTRLLVNIFISKEKEISDNNIEIIGLNELKNISIDADYDLIYQAIYNLVDNAIKFNKKNGYIKVKLYETNENVVLKIRNYGITIKEEDIPYIFDRFYKGDKSRSIAKDSTGLGLYIVKTVANLHNANVTVALKENEETEFTFSIPFSVF